MAMRARSARATGSGRPAAIAHLQSTVAAQRESQRSLQGAFTQTHLSSRSARRTRQCPQPSWYSEPRDRGLALVEDPLEGHRLQVQVRLTGSLPCLPLLSSAQQLTPSKAASHVKKGLGNLFIFGGAGLQDGLLNAKLSI